MNPVISARELSKSFKGVPAVTQLSFDISRGAVFGFLGQNGAGKSTTMRMLLGLVRPDHGSVYINGQRFSGPRRELLSHVGAIIESPDMYGYLSGWDNLRMMASLSLPAITKARLYEVLELVGLRGREQDKVKTYSQGMKQRLGIAIALAHNPDLLILDEPTNGLDPQGIAEMRELIRHLSRVEGKTVLVSSHLLWEIEQVATEMLILHRGRKVAEGSVAQLLRPEDTLFDILMTPDASLLAALAQSPWQRQVVSLTPERLTIRLHPDVMPVLNSWLVTQGGAIREIRSRHSLEAYFLSLTNEPADTTGTI